MTKFAIFTLEPLWKYKKDKYVNYTIQTVISKQDLKFTLQ